MIPEDIQISTDLTEHFREVIDEFKIHGVNNACTDYPTMFKFLLKKYNVESFTTKNNDHALLYWHLTHKVIFKLQKDRILKRCKLFDGTWVFIINKERLLNEQTL